MALSYFCDKNPMPSEEEAAVYWEGIRQYINEFGTVREEWKLY